METILLICSANQWPDCYVIETSVMKELKPILVFTELLIFAGKIKLDQKFRLFKIYPFHKSLVVELHWMVVSPPLRSSLHRLKCLVIITLVQTRVLLRNLKIVLVVNT